MEFIRSFAKRYLSSDKPKNRYPSTWGLRAALAFAAGLTLAPAASYARGHDYGTPQRTVNAAIIGDYGAGLTTSSHIAWPYVFYQLNTHTDAKPVGWTIVNPLAPREVTSDIVSAWGSYYNMGDQVTPDMAPYWEVPLQTTTAQELNQYQILLLELDTVDPLISPPDMEKLRQFVDAGGILWIDGDSSSLALSNSFEGWFSAAFGSGNLSRNTILNGTTILGPPLSTGIPAMNTPYDLSLGSAFDWMPPNAASFASGINDGDVFHFFGERQVDANSLAYVAEGHMSAGAVVLSSTGTAAEVGGFNTTSGFVEPNTISASDTTALQFVADIIGQSTATTTALRNRQPAGAPGDAFGTTVMPTWRYILSTSATTLPQAVSYGKSAYVYNPVDGLLHWFVAAPKGNQASNEYTSADGYKAQPLGSGAAITAISAPTVWPGYANLDGGNPTTVPPYDALSGADGFTTVFMEDQTGAVHWVDMATGNTGTLPSTSFAGSSTSVTGGTTFSGTPPAPFVFDHRLYATQPSGQLMVYDLLPGFSASSGGTYLALPSTISGGSETGMGNPVAGVIHDDCNNLVVSYSTNRGVYTLLAGARAEKLQDAGFDPSGNRMYSPKLSGAAPMDPSNQNGQIDSAVEPAQATNVRLYTLLQNGSRSDIPASDVEVDTSGQHFIVKGTDPGAGEIFADYDVDWAKSQFANGGATPVPGSLDRVMVGFANQNTTSSGNATMISSPVMDQGGDISFIDNFLSGGAGSGGTGAMDSSVICLRDGYPQSAAKLCWRYRLPTVVDYQWFNNPSASRIDSLGNAISAPYGLMDADGHDFSTLGSGLANSDAYSFVGTPVIDSRGNVYAVASDGANSAIFRFKPANEAIGGQSISIDVPPGSSGINPSVQITQQSGGPNGDEFNPTSESPSLFTPGVNFSAQSGGHILLNNFGQLVQPMLYPLFSEGEPINVQYTFANGQTTGQAPPNVGVHTNVAWVADFDEKGNQASFLPADIIGNASVTNQTGSTIPAIGQIGGLAVVGDYLYFTSTNGHLYRLYTNEGDGGNPHAGYLNMTGVNGAKKQILQDLGDAGVGTIVPLTNNAESTGDISASNGTVLVTGEGGVANYQTVMTLVTDRTRLLGLDADGDAMFTVDSTDEAQPNAAGQTVATTHIALNRPTSITQLSTDRYLLADTGNNRCVEIDRSGNILWELSKFVDQFNLLTSGAPTTLNDPTSVEVWRDGCNNVHYLIADSGNYRIVDVVDMFVSTGTGSGTVQESHVLDWVSNTAGRNYRFEHAFRYVVAGPTPSNPSTPVQMAIAALVTNKRVAPMTAASGGSASSLQPASMDSPGQSIVLLDAGFQSAVVAGIGCSNLTSDAGSGNIIDVLDFLQQTTTGTSGSTTNSFSLKNARYLSSYTPDALTMPNGYDGHDELLYCDDDGAFDLDPAWGIVTPLTSAPYANVNWWLGESDYQALTTPIDSNSSTFVRKQITLNGITYPAIPFAPTSLERIGTDAATSSSAGSTTQYYGRYLITNPYTRGSVNSAFGQPNASQPGFGGEVFVYSALAASGGSGANATAVVTDRTFSRPSNTSPLSQPTCAVLAK